ncbi:cytochrome c [Thalassotalea psychrophila]|uniref:Cytochrome c n=1 Tax=Thalassotalea psychrophila TaxID=3065647 RepID=A0ABY9TUW4_9GAMM|nr:cytochrome c [Colwelliaceae bacterium SQ149]
MIKIFILVIAYSFSVNLWANETEKKTETAKNLEVAPETISPDLITLAQQELDFDEQQLLLKQKRLKTHIEFCAPCHGKTGISVVPIYPNLAGQHQEYLLKQLLAFKYRRRKDAVMQGMVSRLNEDDMLELAKYYANISIGPSQPNPTGDVNENTN